MKRSAVLLTLFLAGCAGFYQTDEEYFAAAMTPQQAIDCAAKQLRVDSRPAPLVVYNRDREWPKGVTGIYFEQIDTVLMRYQGDDETLAHEMAHALGEDEEWMARHVGRICALEHTFSSGSE